MKRFFEANRLSASPREAMLALAFCLIAFGIVFVFSATSVKAPDWLEGTFGLRRQLLWATLGVIAFLIVGNLKPETLTRWSGLFFMVALGLLLLVLIPGVGSHVGGSRRWLRIAGFGIQPSEVMKLALLIYVAHIAARMGDNPGSLVTGNTLSRFKYLLAPLAIIGVACICTAAEPDLGTSVFLMLLGVAILLAGGARPLHIALCGIPGLFGVIGILYTKLGYIRDRVDIFLHPDLDPFGKGYQVLQSLLALGSGGFWGLGLGAGRQKVYFIPDDNNDFVLAIIGEEFGWIGTAGLCLVLAGFVVAGAIAARQAPTQFGTLVATGVTFWIGLQGAINIAVASASMPAKGIPLPLVSAGGSSTVVTLAALGVLWSVTRKVPS